MPKNVCSAGRCSPWLTCAKQDTFLSCSRKEMFLEFQRKATRGSVLWTPLEGGEPKGATGVAAGAVRRGRGTRVSLTLNRTSDRDSTPPLPAARGLRSRQHCGRCRKQAWTLHRSCTMLDDRDAEPQSCTEVDRVWRPFFLPPGAALSFFRQDERKIGGRIAQGTFSEHAISAEKRILSYTTWNR